MIHSRQPVSFWGKYVALLVIFLVMMTSQLHSQEFYAGPLAGGAFTQVDGDRYAGYHRVGPVLGGFVGREIWPHWNAQMEIQYIQKGSRKYADVEAGDDRDYSIQLDYIQFPLLMQYTRKSLSFEVGISIASLLGFAEEAYFEAIPTDDQVPFKNIELATLLGINYHFTRNFWINGRMSYSVLPIREPYGGSIPVYDPHWDLQKPGQYNNVITIALYYNLLTR